MMGNDSSGEAVVIEFRSKKFCLHNNLIVDDHLESIECGTCGEKLNPFFAIKKIMSFSSRWKRMRAEAELAREQAEKKTKTKCEHCGKITKIRAKVNLTAVNSRMEENEIEKPN